MTMTTLTKENISIGDFTVSEVQALSIMVGHGMQVYSVVEVAGGSTPCAGNRK